MNIFYILYSYLKTKEKQKQLFGLLGLCEMMVLLIYFYKIFIYNDFDILCEELDFYKTILLLKTDLIVLLILIYQIHSCAFFYKLSPFVKCIILLFSGLHSTELL